MKLSPEFKKNLVAWCVRHEISERQAKELFKECNSSDDYVTALLRLERTFTKREATQLISKLLVGIELSKDR